MASFYQSVGILNSPGLLGTICFSGLCFLTYKMGMLDKIKKSKCTSFWGSTRIDWHVLLEALRSEGFWGCHCSSREYHGQFTNQAQERACTSAAVIAHQGSLSSIMSHMGRLLQGWRNKCDLGDWTTGGQSTSSDTLSLAVWTSKIPSVSALWMPGKSIQVFTFFFLRGYSKRDKWKRNTNKFDPGKKFQLNSNQVRLIQRKTFKEVEMMCSEALNSANNFDITRKDKPFHQGGPEKGN